MKATTLCNALLCACAAIVFWGCEGMPTGPARDNPADPDSPYWQTQRPFINSVTKTPNNHVTVKWISNTLYGVSFRIDRRVVGSGTYTYLGSVPGPLTTGTFVDSSSIPLGFTYGYRVGVVGSAGATTYSYDFPIDMF